MITSWAQLGSFLTTIGIGAILVAVINVVINPKNRAESKQIAQKAVSDAVQTSIDNLRLDLADARHRATEAEKRADEAEARMNKLEAENRAMRDYMYRMARWLERNYREGHSPSIEPPPALPVTGDVA